MLAAAKYIGADRIEIIGNKYVSDKVLSELDTVIPNWREGLINSPLEVNNFPFKDYFVDLLSNNLILHFIMIYLIFMLIIITISRIIIESNVNLDKIKNLPLPIIISSYIHSFVVKLVNVWRYSVNYWLLYTLVCLLLFNCACVYSFYMALSVIN